MSQKHLQGFTLTEIMVALAISSILMAGVLTIMSSSKRTYALQSELSDLQENARFIMEELARDLRMAGYGGCAGPLSNTPFNPSPPNKTETEFDDTQNDLALTDIHGNPYPPSDQLIVMSGGEQLIPTDYTQFRLVGFTDFGRFTLDSDRSLLPEPTDVIRISDCGDGKIYTVNSVNIDGTVEVTRPGSPPFRIYNEPINIFKDINTTITYEVKNIDEDEGGFALFKVRCDDDTPPNCEDEERLIEGVENMQIRYGIDTDSNNIPERYSITATGGNVVSVRITLLMRTTTRRFDLDGATDKSFQLDPVLAYNPQQNNGTFESGYRHRMFTNTIKIRN